MGIWTINGGKRWETDRFVNNDSFKVNLPNEDDCVINLKESDLMLPGLVDFHCHPWAPKSSIDVNVGHSLLSSIGIQACLDAGSYGYTDWEQADMFWKTIDNMDIKATLNVWPEGFTQMPDPINPTPCSEVSVQRMVDMINNSNGRLIGVKVILGTVGDIDEERFTLKIAREVADKTNTFIMIHLTKSKMSIQEVGTYLKSGDVLCHPFHGDPNPLLEADGSYSDTMVALQKSGVLIDMSPGRSHLNWNVMKAAIKKDFKPDFITTDQVVRSWHRKEAMKDLVNAMSAMVFALGFTPEFVAQRVTTDAAKKMNIDLDYTKCITVLSTIDEACEFPDTAGNIITADHRFETSLVIKNGKVMINK